MTRTSTNTRKAQAQAARAQVRTKTIDKLGQLEAELAPMKIKEKEAKDLRAIIATWPEADGYPAAQSVMYEGDSFNATVTGCENRTRVVAMAKAFLHLGKQRFLEICSITLENLRSNLTPEQLSEVVETRADGPRKVSTMVRADKAA